MQLTFFLAIYQHIRIQILQRGRKRDTISPVTRNIMDAKNGLAIFHD